MYWGGCLYLLVVVKAALHAMHARLAASATASCTHTTTHKAHTPQQTAHRQETPLPNIPVRSTGQWAPLPTWGAETAAIMRGRLPFCANMSMASTCSPSSHGLPLPLPLSVLVDRGSSSPRPTAWLTTPTNAAAKPAPREEEDEDWPTAEEAEPERCRPRDRSTLSLHTKEGEAWGEGLGREGEARVVE
jgi:hypothetical protein